MEMTLIVWGCVGVKSRISTWTTGTAATSTTTTLPLEQLQALAPRSNSCLTPSPWPPPPLNPPPPLALPGFPFCYLLPAFSSFSPHSVYRRSKSQVNHILTLSGNILTDSYR